MLVKHVGSSSGQNLHFTRNGVCASIDLLCVGIACIGDFVRGGDGSSTISCLGDFGGFSLLV